MEVGKDTKFTLSIETAVSSLDDNAVTSAGQANFVFDSGNNAEGT